MLLATSSDLAYIARRVIRCATSARPEDEVNVKWGDKEFPLRVVEVAPDDAGAVSLMETDVEVDIAPSQDYEEAMKKMVEDERARLLAVGPARHR